MPAKTITIENNAAATFTVTNITFNTPSGFSHTANLLNLGGTGNFTGASFNTISTLTSATSKTFTIDYNYVSTSTGIYTASIFINCTEGLTKAVDVNLYLASSSAVKVQVDSAYIHSMVPYGTILLYSGLVANIPAGWQLCDGTNSTPNLLNQFIIGASLDDSGQARTSITGAYTKIGGSKNEIMASHTHGITEPNSGQGHRHQVTWNYGIDGAGGQFALDSGSTLVSGTEVATTDITIDNAGESGTDKNLPPFYALAYIMKITNSTFI